jgi:hypothetical protein
MTRHVGFLGRNRGQSRRGLLTLKMAFLTRFDIFGTALAAAQPLMLRLIS